MILAHLAKELGVVNYSRFSKNYTDFFGENPRETMNSTRVLLPSEIIF